ncbi:MAG: cupin domain-containing protein [Methylophilaceae bacterium]
MALHHALSGELIDIRPFGDNLKHESNKTLYKSEHLEVFRMVLSAGKEFPPHKVAGEVTVQCIEGSIEFTINGVSELMREGNLKCLAGGQLHALKAIEDSSVLVTILLHGA